MTTHIIVNGHALCPSAALRGLPIEGYLASHGQGLNLCSDCGRTADLVLKAGQVRAEMTLNTRYPTRLAKISYDQLTVDVDAHWRPSLGISERAERKAEEECKAMIREAFEYRMRVDIGRFYLGMAGDMLHWQDKYADPSTLEEGVNHGFYVLDEGEEPALRAIGLWILYRDEEGRYATAK